MKAIKLFTVVAAIGAAMSISLHTFAGEKYKVADNTTVNWVGKKVTGEHTGNIVLKSGTLEMNKGKLAGGTFEMDMASLTCTDMQGEYGDKLVGHLKSDDFFGVAKYKTAVLKITKVSFTSDGKANVTADLTIKGITQKVSFPVTIKKDGETVMASGQITIDRTKYDIKYGSGSFFDDLGDKMIEDNFILNFDIKAVS
ncbi:MAG: lipid-binding protein [Crocinitomicaceae bacterium]|nr:lipid-binding protein [Crocinitomicaceae bacterium]|tara:strand:+ start:4664 stop:5257 length:594 start_codon:yes stop_codon:yes gene_type:complete